MSPQLALRAHSQTSAHWKVRGVQNRLGQTVHADPMDRFNLFSENKKTLLLSVKCHARFSQFHVLPGSLRTRSLLHLKQPHQSQMSLKYSW